jgi:DNA-binding NtrC family response regulator
VDVRIIAATNRDLEAALAESRFREDLYYRLKVVTIVLPPLNERPDDILLLTEYFLTRFAAEAGIDNPGIAREAMSVLNTYPWPGNVRELANTIQKTLIFNRGAPISPEDITQAISGRIPGKSFDSKSSDEGIRQWVRKGLLSMSDENIFDSFTDHFASILISEALNITGGNRSETAKLLGVSRPTLHSKIEKYHLKFETSVKED